jgi:hypothetical protein
MITHIRHGQRPSCPTGSSWNRWLQDHVWDTITTCWSNKPQQRCELSVVHHVFSTSDPQDALIGFPPVGHENLIRLTEELLYTFPVLPLDSEWLATLKSVQEYICDVISKDETSPASLSSVDVVALVEKFYEVYFPATSFPQHLKLPPVRPSQPYHPPCYTPHFACGSDFIHTPSSLNHKSSKMWKFVMNPWATCLLGSQIFGREIAMEDQCVSRLCGHRVRPN